jgi:hypothetical protein
MYPVSASRSNTLITMVKSANFSDGYDRAILHDFALNRALFAQRQTWARSIQFGALGPGRVILMLSLVNFPRGTCHDCHQPLSHSPVVNFEDAKFPRFNKAQQLSTRYQHLIETKHAENKGLLEQAGNRLGRIGPHFCFQQLAGRSPVQTTGGRISEPRGAVHP